MTDTQFAFLLFVILWVITFFPAWYLLGKLVIYSLKLSGSLVRPGFWVSLLAYIFVIILPYIPLIIWGDSLSGLTDALIIAAMTLGVAIALARIFLAKHIEKMLWGAYGYVYDGLLHFYPYTNLIDMAVNRLNINHSDKILDLGCGSGNASLLILKKSPKFLLASDNSKSMMRPLRRKFTDYENVKVTRKDAVVYLRSLPDKSLDKILLINVLYAVHNRHELWQELIRVLRDNGKIVMTSSDRGGSRAIIREHLHNASFWQLLHPKLIAVFVIDSLISTIAASGGFHFISREEMLAEINMAGGKATEIERCYGGKEQGVNLMITVLKQ